MAVVYVNRHVRYVQVLLSDEGSLLHCLTWESDEGFVFDIHALDDSSFSPKYDRIYMPFDQETMTLHGNTYILY
ncbi:hypothetical protein [Marinococcus sp. PL1-022]|uniref:hypothetical protein n=1 Tax=Marinococcus sp. PL1-022 TaxID=3095363 RepID=UPI0029C18F12|nr:hypothetical protein [Marinococcus sp. PL1-022]MDX6152850.1 hypothetical protein [Marinococcus sp. PL1-022]